MSERGFEVVVVGAVGVDTNVYLYGQEIDFSVEGNFSQNLDCVGQAGGFSARLAAGLGWRTALIGFVGEDACGRMVREALADDGVDLQGLHIDPAGTKRSVNFMYPDGRRRNFYDGKGSMESPPDLERCRGLLRGARLAHFSIVNWARELLPVARSLGVPISCDLQDVVDPADSYRRDFSREADILFFSATNHGDPAGLVEDFLAQRPGRTVVCGMGSRGCAVGTADGLRFFEPMELDEPVVDTNGAGDSLAVGFLCARLLEGRSIEESVHRGQLLARSTCTARGSTDDLIDPARMEALLRRGRGGAERTSGGEGA